MEIPKGVGMILKQLGIDPVVMAGLIEQVPVIANRAQELLVSINERLIDIENRLAVIEGQNAGRNRNNDT